MNWVEWIYPACVLLAGYTVLGITGFGSALIVVPMLAWIWPLPQVVVLAIMLDIVASTLHGGLNIRQVRWPAIRAMLPGIAVGSLIGLWLLGQLDKRWPLLILGIYVALVGLKNLRQTAAPSGQTISATLYNLGSTLVGMLEVMFATAGPVVLVLLQRRLGDVALIRASVPVVMVLAGLIAVAVLASSQPIINTVMLERLLVGLPVAAFGVWLGNRLARFITPAVMRRIMAALLFISGISLTRNFWL